MMTARVMLWGAAWNVRMDEKCGPNEAVPVNRCYFLSCC